MTRTRSTKTTADLPDSVKIGWRDYRIVELSAAQGAAKRRYGECDNTLVEIRVDLTFGLRQAASTLLHEIIHAIFYLWNLDPLAVLAAPDKQEFIVAQLSDGLSTVWRDNPEVMAWIARHHGAA